MDETINKLLSTVSTLTSQVERLTEAVSKQSGITERVVAAQERAIEKMDAPTGSTTGRGRGRPPKADAAAETAPAQTATATAEPDPTPVADTVHPLLAAPNNETAPVVNPKTKATEQAPTGNYRAATFGRDEVKNEFMGWIGEVNDPAVRKERGEFVKSISAHFGVGLPFHPTEGLVDEEHRKQALYFLRRKREGLNVDFSADYDFDGDPLAAADDDMDSLG